MNRKIRMLPVSVRLSPVIHHSLSRMAEQQKMTIADAIRQCIADALDNHRKEDHYSEISKKLDGLITDTHAIRSVIEQV